MNISPDEIVLFKIPANIFGRHFYIDINMTHWGQSGKIASNCIYEISVIQ